MTLPEGWRKVKIGDLWQMNKILIQNGYAQGTHNQDGNGVPHIRPFNITNNGEIDLSTVKYVSPPADNSSYWLRPNDVIFNNTNSEELVGKTAYFSLDGQFVLSNHMTIIRILDSGTIEAYWLAKKFQHLWELGEFTALCRRHVNQASVSLERLKDVQIPLPPLPEQQAIAHTLRTVQRAREIRQRELALERERKATLMEHLFTCGPQAEALATQETRFGEVPKHWQILPLSDCSFVQTGVTKGRKFNNDPTIIVPYLRVANVQDGHLDLSEIKEIRIRKSELDRYRLQVGDVVLTEGGDFDKLGRGFIWRGEISDCIHQNHVFAVRVNRELLYPEYFAYLAQSNYGKAYFLSVAHRTTNLASINSTKLKALPTLIPPLSEQQEVINILQACDDKIAALERELALLEELFRAMLEELMTGRIRLNDYESYIGLNS